MKNTIFLIGFILFIVNLVIGFIVTAYHFFNIAIISIVVITTTLLLWYLKYINLKEGFYIALTIIFCILSMATCILGVFALPDFSNNWCIIVMVLIFALKITLLFIVKSISKSIQH